MKNLEALKAFSTSSAAPVDIDFIIDYEDGDLMFEAAKELLKK